MKEGREFPKEEDIREPVSGKAPSPSTTGGEIIEEVPYEGGAGIDLDVEYSHGRRVRIRRHQKPEKKDIDTT